MVVSNLIYLFINTKALKILNYNKVFYSYQSDQYDDIFINRKLKLNALTHKSIFFSAFIKNFSKFCEEFREWFKYKMGTSRMLIW